MMEPPANTQIWIAAGVTDLRRGFTGLSALVQTKGGAESDVRPAILKGRLTPLQLPDSKTR